MILLASAGAFGMLAGDADQRENPEGADTAVTVLDAILTNVRAINPPRRLRYSPYTEVDEQHRILSQGRPVIRR